MKENTATQISQLSLKLQYNTPIHIYKAETFQRCELGCAGFSELCENYVKRQQTINIRKQR